MRLIIAAVGKLKDGPERALCQRYVERLDALGRSIGLGPVRVVEIPESRETSAPMRKSAEAQKLVIASGEEAVRIVLDERGKALMSEAFAALVRGYRDEGRGTLAFLIGGADGHGPAALDGAMLRLSLGAMTLPHGLARIVLAEQLYRAATILAGHPYHRG